MAKSNKKKIMGVGEDALKLIQKFDSEVKERLSTKKFIVLYASIDDILINKYHLKEIDNIEAPFLDKKTEFVTKGVRGNLKKAEGNILSYTEANAFIKKAIEEELP